MEELKKKVGYSRVVYDPVLRESVTRGKSLTRITDEALRILTDRIMDYICAEILPGIKKAELRREVEDWLGIK